MIVSVPENWSYRHVLSVGLYRDRLIIGDLIAECDHEAGVGVHEDPIRGNAGDEGEEEATSEEDVRHDTTF